jgi:hypothetical protein
LAVYTPTITAGAAGRAGILATSLYPQIAKRMPTLNENVTPLISLSMKLSKKPVQSTVFGHNEDQPLPYLFQYNGATETTPGTTFTIAQFTNSGAWLEDDILFNPATGERLQIASAITTTCTVVRNFQGTTKLLTTGDQLIRIGNAREEGVTTARLARSTAEAFYTFYLQNLNWTKLWTEPEIAQALWTDPRKVIAHKKMMIEAKIDLEFAAYFGFHSADIGGASYAQPMGVGLDEWIERGGNINHLPNGILTFDEIEKGCEAPHSYGARDGFILFMGTRFSRIVNGFTRGQLQIRQDEKYYGSRINYLQTTYGDVDLVTLPLMSGGNLGGYAWLVPKPFENYVYLRYLSGNGVNGDFALKPNTHANDSQVVRDELRAWLGMEFYEYYKFAKFDGAQG